MEEELTKPCPNCKRDIPSVNFTIHQVHCSRNIRVCPVCKEPVLLADLEKHHDNMHKQLPCKQCGEKVCGTDLEDHLRDSCANTVKTCRYCELELTRGELPMHEGYCGVRTELCPECHEWVMIKYRQLHLDSNHGFLRLDDDPVLIPTRPRRPVNLNSFLANPTISTNGMTSPFGLGHGFGNINQMQYRNMHPAPWGMIPNGAGASRTINPGANGAAARPSVNPANVATREDGSNQVDTNDGNVDGVRNDLPLLSGAMKKRPAPQPPMREPPASQSARREPPAPQPPRREPPAPQPPRREPPANPLRDLPYYSAIERHRLDELRRLEMNTYNMALGLPLVTSPAQKLEQVRQMDALSNRNNDYSERLRANVMATNTGHVLRRAPGFRVDNNAPGPSQSGVHPNYEWTAGNARPFQHRLPFNTYRPPGMQNISQEAKNALRRNKDYIEKKRELDNLIPMNTEEFMKKFKDLQVQRDREDSSSNQRSGDRFNDIKSSLKDLRRDLNEVTAPYNTNPVQAGNNHNDNTPTSPGLAAAMDVAGSDEPGVQLPCEFCGEPVPMDQLVLHQTGCRPDLAQFRAGSSPPPAAPSATRSPDAAADYVEPVIPCEFCSESLPVYLVSEHQKRCGRDNEQIPMFFAD